MKNKKIKWFEIWFVHLSLVNKFKIPKFTLKIEIEKSFRKIITMLMQTYTSCNSADTQIEKHGIVVYMIKT